MARRKIDARKLAERLRLNELKPLYHGETGVRMLRQLAPGYLTVIKDLSRVIYQQLDLLQHLRQKARRETPRPVTIGSSGRCVRPLI
jgi:hypothetical protein